jgi:hypothetical protein
MQAEFDKAKDLVPYLCMWLCHQEIDHGFYRWALQEVKSRHFGWARFLKELEAVRIMKVTSHRHIIP